MRCADRPLFASALFVLALAVQPRTAVPVDAHGQRYAMGTMFDIVAYHASRADAARAVEAALDEVVRLDRVMSHFDARSELARLQRDGRTTALTVDPSLYDVIRLALDVSRRSEGRFDVTIAPLLRVWKTAESEGRRPTPVDVASVRRCVGYTHIELTAPDRIRLKSDCVALDLGGIGKGYAVDRALDVLRRAGVSNAVVNAGGSSIAVIGSPAGENDEPHTANRERRTPNYEPRTTTRGWPVLLAGGRRVLTLTRGSISTSQQDPGPQHGDIIDPIAAAPAGNRLPVVVCAPEAALSDALSTTLVMMTIDEGRRLLAQFPGVSALWLSSAGDVRAAHGASQLTLARAD